MKDILIIIGGLVGAFFALGWIGAWLTVFPVIGLLCVLGWLA